MKLIPMADGGIDLARNDAGQLVAEKGLETAVIISLLTDRRADVDDALPVPTKNGPVPPDRRGWAGDAFDQQQRIGSRLWLLEREKQTEETRQRAIFYAREALEWMVEDGHVITIDVEAQWSSRGRLDMLIRLGLPDGGYFETTVQAGGVYAI